MRDMSSLSHRSHKVRYSSNARNRSRSNQSLWSNRKAKEERELITANLRQLERLQGAKCSFDVLKWNKQERDRQKLLGNLRQYPEKPVQEVVRKRPPIKRALLIQRQSHSSAGSPRPIVL